MTKKNQSFTKTVFNNSIEYTGEFIAFVNAGSEAFQKYPLIINSLGKFALFTSGAGLSIATTAGLVVSCASFIAMYKLYDDSVGQYTSKIISVDENNTQTQKAEKTKTELDQPSVIHRILSVIGQIFGTMGSVANAILSAFNGWLIGSVFHLPLEVLMIMIGVLSVCGFFGTFALGRPPVVACFEDFATLITKGSPYFSLDNKKYLVWTLFVITVSLIGAIAAGLLVAIATQTIALHIISQYWMMPSALITTLMAIFASSTGLITAGLMGRAVHAEGINLIMVSKGKTTLGFGELTRSQQVRSILAVILATALAIGASFGGFFGTQAILINSLHLATTIGFPLAGGMAAAFGILTFGLVTRPLQLELVHKDFGWKDYTTKQKIVSSSLMIASIAYRLAPVLAIYVLPIVGIPVSWPFIVGIFVASFVCMMTVKYIERNYLKSSKPNESNTGSTEVGAKKPLGKYNDPSSEIVYQPEATQSTATTYGHIANSISSPGNSQFAPITIGQALTPYEPPAFHSQPIRERNSQVEADNVNSAISANGQVL
jgi:hypothetical protein